jgi:hypothetical protein
MAAAAAAAMVEDSDEAALAEVGELADQYHNRRARDIRLRPPSFRTGSAAQTG